ncbi:ferrous iron transport protein B [Methanobrevibacter cuticularis]|uniref:Ferrous iron transport protein B n=1 Tax=Methanobrevibacter cuticularis TaxID=47311 RepID=A0A166EB19_9EURY|nr:ferrous iron transport protein B [Methanobrevibacter cuticularis]KZX16464.1 ferrous iron transport protein B [Methanobrevibacter cuticularis]
MENIKIGLAGNPNVGKTTLFNYLTGMRQHVGNWPGKTVEKAEGHLNYKGDKVEVIDLPGNYALTAHSIEEIISRDFIVDESSDVIVNVVDASNLERNLYLTTQMMELGANLIIALNMNKFAKNKEHNINSKELSKLLGIPVIEIEAIDGTGVDSLLDEIKKVSSNSIDSSKKLVYGKELTLHLTESYDDDGKELLEIPEKHNSIIQAIEKDKNLLDVPATWTAIKLLENDKIVTEKVKASPEFRNIFKELDSLEKHLKDVFGEDPEEIIANYRYAFIDGLIKESVDKPDFEKPTTSDKIDKYVTNRLLGIPIFIAIMWLTFQITFTVAEPFQGLIEEGFTVLGDFLLSTLGENIVSSFLVDGIIGGVGGVLVFLPVIFLMFLMISILEDSGYLARAAFVMDKVMHKAVGLHGKAFIPMILGFGCGVPAVMATRTMEHERDRLLTMLIVPFMSCTARIPVYALFVAAFFTANQGNIVLSIYLLGIAVAIIVAAILKKAFFKGITSPFVMELPTYKVPSVKGVLIHTWEKGYGFIRKAGTIILLLSILVWALGSLPAGVDYGTQESYLGQIGTVAAPVFAPLGFGDWQPAVALIVGIGAKEVVVSTFSSLFEVSEEGEGISNALKTLFTPLTAYAFMAFVLLYVPCFAFVGTIKSETNSWKWPGVLVLVTFVTAYVVSFLIYQGGLLLGLA